MPRMTTTSKASPTKKRAEDYLAEKYARIIIPDDAGGFTAEILEFPGCFSYGVTADEAYANLEKAAADWIDAALAQGQEIPPPTTSGGFSGRVVLRLPRGLHQRAARTAERNRTSLNQFFITAIATAVGAEDIFHRITQRLQQTQFNLNAVVLFSQATPLATTEGRMKHPAIISGDAVTNETASLFTGLTPVPVGAEAK